MRHEFHACDCIRLPYDTACAVLDANRREVLERATETILVRAPAGGAPRTAPAGGPRVVTAALERDGGRAATLAMHWIQDDRGADVEGGLSAWLHCHLRLLPRQAGTVPFTEVLLTARCETSPDAEAIDEEVCAGFLHQVVTEVERAAALEPAPR